MIKPIHPFPARMAPELAINELSTLSSGSIVLDPMAGSGTVVRQALEFGHQAIGFDMDPLAVLMTRTWTTPVDDAVVEKLCADILDQVTCLNSKTVDLDWIDSDSETSKFVDFWFARPQRQQLRKLAFVLDGLNRRRIPAIRAAANVLRIAMSRTIVTKSEGASLARDVSHSRPHKVAETSNFDVLEAFEHATKHVRRLLKTTPSPSAGQIALGDARNLVSIRNQSIDCVITSPPYLNAIDYMRGHRLSLVWLGHRLSDLRQIRSSSIGAERSLGQPIGSLIETIKSSMGKLDSLSGHHHSMISRYAFDIYKMMAEIARVLRGGGKAVLVVGNSCLKGVFISNSNAVVRAGIASGLRLTSEVERDLPVSKRYLPIPETSADALGKRMRTESVITFAA